MCHQRTMICDGNMCGGESLDVELYRMNDGEENFIENLKHIKCKLIQLVREQAQTARERQVKIMRQAKLI